MADQPAQEVFDRFAQQSVDARTAQAEQLAEASGLTDDAGYQANVALIVGSLKRGYAAIRSTLA